MVYAESRKEVVTVKDLNLYFAMGVCTINYDWMMCSPLHRQLIGRECSARGDK